MINVGIVGGSGYVGGELLRFLLFHPNVKIIGVASQTHAGEKISSVHPQFTKLTNLFFENEDISLMSRKADVIFFALPSGVSMQKMQHVDLKKTKVIDCGPDFRFSDSEAFEKIYNIPHAAKEIAKQAVYGLPEVNKEEIAKATIVANPGCFPTGALLALFPLAKAKLLTNSVVIDGKTGSSGSGIKPTELSHHPERAHDFKAYGVFSHRHGPEINQLLNLANKKPVDMVFTPHTTPMVRGIFTTAYVFLEKEKTIEEIKKLYEKTYANSPFIRLVNNTRSAVVLGSNFCDIALFVNGKKIIVTSSIDNLVKGAAGQAVQNMNIMFGISETTGLLFPGLHP